MVHIIHFKNITKYWGNYYTITYQPVQEHQQEVGPGLHLEVGQHQEEELDQDKEGVHQEELVQGMAAGLEEEDSQLEGPAREVQTDRIQEVEPETEVQYQEEELQEDRRQEEELQQGRHQEEELQEDMVEEPQQGRVELVLVAPLQQLKWHEETKRKRWWQISQTLKRVLNNQIKC